MGDSNLLKKTFSKVVSDYEYARPKYPIELYQKVCDFSGIGEGANILEVGAGTGQATDLFLSENQQFDLVEVSEEQVQFLKEKYSDHSNVSVKQAYFEEYNSAKKYDLIYSATAFHWVKSEVGYPKAWEMLKDGGSMAVFWHMSSVTYHSGGIFEGLNKIKIHYLPDESLGFDDVGIKRIIDKRISQIKTGAYFGEPEIHEYKWIDSYDTDRYIALINTYSSTQLLENRVREEYLNEVRKYIDANGGMVDLPQLVHLYLVKK